MDDVCTALKPVVLPAIKVVEVAIVNILGWIKSLTS
jgi:hypothetical protein